MTLFGKLLLAISLFATPAAAAGDAISAQDQQSVQSVIKNQIEAFLADDSDAAFQFAAPNIKNFFPNANLFMDMVKRGYQPVYRPNQYKFGKTQGNETRVAQSVLIEDSNGVAYEALYELHKQEDGRWLIAGVYLQKLPQAGA
ncbi:MAG: DUF4864 domain-containing protein [Hyphomicrobiales bacterium]